MRLVEYFAEFLFHFHYKRIKIFLTGSRHRHQHIHRKQNADPTKCLDPAHKQRTFSLNECSILHIQSLTLSLKNQINHGRKFH